MANNSNCGCMGTLRHVHGPMWHCPPPPPPNPDYYQNFPYYNGPCPPPECNSSGCNKGCKHRCKCCDHCHHDHCHHDHCHHCHGNCSHTQCNAAMFSANAPLQVSAGNAIPLEPRISNPDCFDDDGGCVRIRRPGLYHVTWTANIPSYQCVNARLYLTLNGREIPGSGQTICTQADNTSTSVTGQAMVSTPPNGLLCLVSDGNICIRDGCSVENVFTMSITKAQN